MKRMTAQKVTIGAQSRRLDSIDTLLTERRLDDYAGDVSPLEAWRYLITCPEAVLVDVRTAPEWLFVGEPDLSKLPNRLLKLSWKTYPSFAVNPQFAEQLRQEGMAPDTLLFFMCRSGGRSQDAARSMTQQGFRYCFNINDGFEGELDSGGHRGASGGWKAAGLPWIQG